MLIWYVFFLPYSFEDRSQLLTPGKMGDLCFVWKVKHFGLTEGAYHLPKVANRIGQSAMERITSAEMRAYSG